MMSYPRRMLFLNLVTTPIFSSSFLFKFLHTVSVPVRNMDIPFEFEKGCLQMH